MNNTDTNTRGEHRSTLKSKGRSSTSDYPREPNGTIVGDMLRIMQLVEDNKKIRSKR